MIRYLFLAITIIFYGHAPASAQNYTVNSVSGGNLGTIVSATSGSSQIEISAGSGASALISGSAVRLTNSPANFIVSISCNGNPNCDTSNVIVTLTPSGSAQGRIGSISAVTASAGSATVMSTRSLANSTEVVIGPIGRNSSKTLQLGYTISISGNEASATTGSATASLLVTASRPSSGGSSSMSGAVVATVIRPVTIGKVADLQFGSITRPVTGSGILSIDGTGTVSVTGTGVRRLPVLTPTAAQFAITGEGGQAISVNVPQNFSLSGPNGSLIVNTTSTGAGNVTLPGNLGSGGQSAVIVGGSIVLDAGTAAGIFSGSLQVWVQYN